MGVRLFARRGGTVVARFVTYTVRTLSCFLDLKMTTIIVIEAAMDIVAVTIGVMVNVANCKVLSS